MRLILERRREKPRIFQESKKNETSYTTDTKQAPPIDKGRYAFQYLAAMFIIETTVWGFATSFGVLFRFYQNDPRSPIKPYPNAKLILTLVGTISTGVMAAAVPFFSFWISKKPGIRRRLMFFGLLTCILSVFLSAYSTSAVHVLLSQGIAYGIGGCALYFSALSYLPEWFQRKKGFANGVVFTGSGMGGLAFPFVLDALLGRYGAQLALQIVTILFAVPTALAVFFIRPRVLQSKQHDDSLGRSVSDSDKPVPPTWRDLFRNFYRCLTGIFWIYIFLNTIQSTVFYLPGLYLPTYVDCLGRGSETGSALLAILNAGTMIAQFAAGVLSDYYSPFLIGASANVLASASVLILWGALSQYSIAWLFVFSAVYGSTAGAWTSLYFGVLSHFMTDQDLLFAAYGMVSMTRGLGNIIGGPVSAPLVVSTMDGSHQCGGFPQGPFSGLVWFTGLVFLICGLIGCFLWLHFRRRSSKMAEGVFQSKHAESTDSIIKG